AAPGARAPPDDALRYRGVGSPLRGLGRAALRPGPGPVRRLALGPEHPDADPGPRPGRNLPALLHPGRRLAALGLGGQSTALLGIGRPATGPPRHRSSVHVLLCGNDPDVLRRDRVLAAGTLSQGPRWPGHPAPVLGPRLPRRRL